MSNGGGIPDEIREIARITGAEAIVYVDDEAGKIHISADNGKEYSVSSEAAKKRRRNRNRGPAAAAK